MTAPSALTYTGPYPANLWRVLHHLAEGGPMAVSANLARSLSPAVALAASCGFITVVSVAGDEWRPYWRITASGLTALEHKEALA